MSLEMNSCAKDLITKIRNLLQLFVNLFKTILTFIAHYFAPSVVLEKKTLNIFSKKRGVSV